MADVNEQLVELLPTIRRVATQYHREYPGIEFDDIYQELCLFVLEKGGSIKPEMSPAYILSRRAKQYCGEESMRASMVVANYTYSPRDVRRMLRDALTAPERTYVAGGSTGAEGGVRSTEEGIEPAAAANWDAVAAASDVKAALQSAPKADREVLFRAYVCLAELTPAERKAAGRAVDRLTAEMNRYKVGKSKWHQANPDYVGSRHRLSQATE